jgi:hypothetical protein
LFLAFSPTSWHGWHFRNEFSPAETSCASAAPDEIANAKTEIVTILIIQFLVCSLPVPGPDACVRARFAALEELRAAA